MVQVSWFQKYSGLVRSIVPSDTTLLVPAVTDFVRPALAVSAHRK